MMTITTKRLRHGQYEVTDGQNVYRVTHLNGAWEVREQSVNGCDHWFLCGIESKKREALRLIEDGVYAREAAYRRMRNAN